MMLEWEIVTWDGENQKAHLLKDVGICLQKGKAKINKLAFLMLVECKKTVSENKNEQGNFLNAAGMEKSFQAKINNLTFWKLVGWKKGCLKSEHQLDCFLNDDGMEK